MDGKYMPIQASKRQKAQKVIDSLFSRTVRRREIDAPALAMARSVDGERNLVMEESREEDDADEA